jgi:hypothetical protein
MIADEEEQRFEQIKADMAQMGENLKDIPEYILRNIESESLALTIDPLADNLPMRPAQTIDQIYEAHAANCKFRSNGPITNFDDLDFNEADFEDLDRQVPPKGDDVNFSDFLRMEKLQNTKKCIAQSSETMTGDQKTEIDSQKISPEELALQNTEQRETLVKKKFSFRELLAFIKFKFSLAKT